MTGISAGLSGLMISHMPPGTLFLAVGIIGTVVGTLGFRVATLRKAH
jgi:hypothetical protein